MDLQRLLLYHAIPYGRWPLASVGYDPITQLYPIHDTTTRWIHGLD